MQKRNKYLTSFSENAAAVKELLNSTEGAELTESELRGILAACAGQLLQQRFEDTEFCQYGWLVEELRGCEAEPVLGKKIHFVYVYKEDLLGFLYLSLRERKERKESGSYYTPQTIAKRLINALFEATVRKNASLLDPACGTGGILLELPEECELQQTYGYDIDPIAIAIVRINMALRYRLCDKTLLTTHFVLRNFLLEGVSEPMQLILGNPPWGSSFSAEEKAEFRQFRTGASKSPESGNLFVEKGLESIQPGGSLCFVLPEALLHVKSHRCVRELIAEQSDIQRIEYLGEVFDTVQCPSVIMTLRRKRTDDTDEKQQIDIVTDAREFSITADEKRLSADGFLLDATEEEYTLLQKLEKMEQCVTLRGKAQFALGIVTGNNAKYLSKQERMGSEAVFRGADISRFRINEPSAYLQFTPEHYQQIAPINIYRAPEKLLYRFIGERPVFAYDNKQRLTLNSCNIVIPVIEGLDMRYIMSVFNSRVIAFWHKRRNHSMKLLRAHIEAFPIPVVSKEQQLEIIALSEQVLDEMGDLQDTKQRTYDSVASRESVSEELDRAIAELYQLTEEEYEQIKQVV